MDDLTIRTYDRIAAQFAARNWEFDQVDARVAFARAIAGDNPPSLYRVLDAGCGPGRDCAWFRERGFQALGVRTRESRQHGWFVPDALPTPMYSRRHVEFILDALAIRAGHLTAPVVRRHQG